MSKQTSILIADDEATMRDACRQVLASDEFLLKEAANGDEALKVVQRESLDLVILDLRMPGVGGMEMLRWMEAESPGTPVAPRSTVRRKASS